MRVIHVSKTHEQNLHNMGAALHIRKRLEEALKEHDVIKRQEGKQKAQESADKLMSELKERYSSSL